MFEWFESELSIIRTPRFHIVDGPAEPNLRDAIIKSPLYLPKSYKEFVLRFGNAKLYRKSLWGYTIGVFAGPRKAKLQDNGFSYQIGYHDGAIVFVKTEANRSEFSIYERELQNECKVGTDFEEWLRITCAKARGDYGAKKWKELERGPAPFSPKEEEIVVARQLMDWRVLSIDSYGDHIFEVTNKGCSKLPVLTVGVRSIDGRLNGALRLKTINIGPGETAILHAPCYKDLVPPQQIEVFSLPNPQPEDREYYAEFRTR